MPRLMKSIKGDHTGLAHSTWGSVLVGAEVGDDETDNIPNRARLTTIVIQLDDMGSLTRNLYWGLSEDSSGNWPITGLYTVDLRDVKNKGGNVYGGLRETLNMDYIASENATTEGKLYFWFKVDGSDTVICRAHINFSEENDA